MIIYHMCSCKTKKALVSAAVNCEPTTPPGAREAELQ